MILLSLLFAATLPCQASDALSAEIDSVESELAKTPPLKQAAFFDRYAALAKKYPNEAQAQQEWVSFATWRLKSRLPEVVAYYRAAHADPVAHYAFIKALKGAGENEEAKRELAAADPASPPVQRLLMRQAKEAQDKAAMAKHFEQYLAMCPDDLWAYDDAKGIVPAARIASFAARVRQQMAKMPATKAAEHLPLVWNLEFESTPVPKHAALRERVRADLKKIEAEPPALAILSAKLEGLALLGEDASAVEDALITHYPFFWRSSNLIAQRAKIAEKNPGDDATLEELRAYAKKVFDASQDWITRYPDHEVVWMERFYTFSDLPELPNDVVLATADKCLAFWRAEPESFSTPFDIASLYVKRNVRLAEVPALVAAVRAGYEAKRKTLSSYPEAMRPKVEAYLREHASELTRLEAEFALLKKDDKTARAKLAELDTALAAEKKPEATLVAAAAMLRAKLETAAGKKADALAYWLKAQNTLAGEKGSDALMKRAETEKAITVTWKDLGGSPEASAFLRPPTAPAKEETAERWDAVSKPLPAFSLSDLSGKTFTRDQLKGKVTFVNVWATWCGPCRAELPHVEKLRALAKAKNIQVVSFNVDDNPGLVSPYVMKEKITMPIVLASSLLEQMGGVGSLPRSWVVDGTGRIVQELVGFYATDTWAEQTLAQIQKLVKH